jgi:hypothetical protein
MQRVVLDDHEAFAPDRGQAGKRRHRLAGHVAAEVPVEDVAGEVLAQLTAGEVLAQLTVGGSRPARRVSTAEPGDQPPQLRERGMPELIEPAFDELLERGPARLAVLAGDGKLSVMEGSELAGGQAAPGFQLQVTEVRLTGKRTRLIRHGSPSSCPGIRGAGREDHKDQSCGSSPYAAGELKALPADPGAAGTTAAYGIPARQTGNPTFATLFTNKTRRIAGALAASTDAGRPVPLSRPRAPFASVGPHRGHSRQV